MPEAHIQHLTPMVMIILATLTCGLVFEKLKQPAALGYIIGGILIAAFKVNVDREAILHLADLGVTMLLFLIGMELNLKSFKMIWRLSIGVTILNIIVTSFFTILIGWLFKFSTHLSIVLAFSISLSSTAIAIKMLQSIGELRTETGKFSIGILVAQDLLIVPMIILLQNLNVSYEGYLQVILKILLAVGLLLITVMALSRKEKLSLPFATIYSNHEDLQPLVAMLFCFGMAALSGVLQLSEAYGAFIGGLIVGNSQERQAMLNATKPTQSLLMMVFFVAVGLLMDFNYIWHNLFKVLFLLIFITLGKTILNIIILHLFKINWSRSFLISLILSPMGEFAFVLSNAAIKARIITSQDEILIVTLAALSLMFGPIWLMVARKLHYRSDANDSVEEVIHTVYSSNKCANFCKTNYKKLYDLLMRLKKSKHK